MGWIWSSLDIFWERGFVLCTLFQRVVRLSCVIRIIQYPNRLFFFFFFSFFSYGNHFHFFFQKEKTQFDKTLHRPSKLLIVFYTIKNNRKKKIHNMHTCTISFQNSWQTHLLHILHHLRIWFHLH